MNINSITEDKILEAEGKLTEAMKSSDVQTLDELLHDDLRFVLPTGEVITKKIDLDTHKSGNLILKDISSTIDSITLIEENAIVTISSKISGQMMKQKFEGNFRYIRVWKVYENQVKVVAGSCIAL